jgi:hypothetical protein
MSKLDHSAHFEALTSDFIKQLGPSPVAGKRALARRIAGLVMVCEQYETELAKSGRINEVKVYLQAQKSLQSALVASGLVLNPRTATVGATKATQADSHAALMFED